MADKQAVLGNGAKFTGKISNSKSIEINGLPAQGSNESWAPGSTAGNCIENPYSCDVVGAFLNGVCVGWNYVDSSLETQTTIQVQGFYNSPNLQDLTQNYCQENDLPSFYIFDSSSHEIYLLSEQQQYPWYLSLIHISLCRRRG